MDSVQEKHPDPAPTVNRLRDEKGAELLQLLAGISAEGDLTKPQINGLKRWRKTVGAAGIGILESMSEIVGRIVGRGSIDQSDWLELQLVIERVLPVTERGIERKGKTWRNAPVTAMQRDYIAVLGGSLQPTAKTTSKSGPIRLRPSTTRPRVERSPERRSASSSTQCVTRRALTTASAHVGAAKQRASSCLAPTAASWPARATP